MSFYEFAENDLRRVSIENLRRGSLRVEQVEGNELRGTINSSDDELMGQLRIRFDGGHLRIDLPRPSGPEVPVQIAIQSPAGLDWAVTAGSADVALGAAAGRAQVTSGSGDVHVAEAREAQVTTGSGDVSVDAVTGRALQVTNGSGDVRVGRAGPATEVAVKSGSGDISVEHLAGRFEGRTGSGDITVPETAGTVDLRSASGDLTVGVTDGLPAWLDLDSVSGDVRITLDATTQPGPDEAYVSVKARTASGDITVYRA